MRSVCSEAVSPVFLSQVIVSDGILMQEAESDLEVNMTEVPIVYGPLSSCIDRDDQVDLELACLSNMSITIIIIPNIKIHLVLLNFIF